MCIIAVVKKGYVLTESTLYNCWNNHKDGAGIMYAKNNKLFCVKELESFAAFKQKYTEVNRISPDSDIVLHFRKANVGDISLENCHPFMYGDIGFVHNGTIYPEIPTGKKNKNKSDTYMFGWHFISKMNLSFIRNPLVAKMLSYYIGHSKVVVMESNGDYEIINEGYGERAEHVWFSNDTYKKLRNVIDRDYGRCKRCKKRLFGSAEQKVGKCNNCCDVYNHGLCK